MKIYERPGEVIGMKPMGEGHWYVRGHVTPEDAYAAVDSYCEDYGDETPRFGPVQHVWGRWRLVTDSSGVCIDEDCDHYWDWVLTARPGWAKVTRVWEWQEWRDLHERRAVEYATRQLVQRAYPGALISHVYAPEWRNLKRTHVKFTWCGIDADWKPWADKHLLIAAEPGLGIHTRYGLLSRWADLRG